MATILITGAAGRIGTEVAPLLRDAGHRLRLLDLRRPENASACDEVFEASATDEAAMLAAARGSDLLVHLAGFPVERTWREILDTNLEAWRVALDTARDAPVPVTLLASSVHAVGFTPADEADGAVPAVRPDSYYGWAKAAGEALAQLYADRFGMRIVSARIMNFDDRPRVARARSNWVSPADLARLVTASLGAPVGHLVVWGVSANTRRVVSLEAGRTIGYEPQDDAEGSAARLEPGAGVEGGPLGGDFTTRPLGERW